MDKVILKAKTSFRVVLLGAAAALLAVASGCGGGNPAQETPPVSQTPETPEISEPTPISPTPSKPTPEDTAHSLLLAMQSGDADEILSFMDDTMKSALGDAAGGMWQQLESAYGEFSGAGEDERADADGYEIVLTEVRFSDASLIQRTVIDKSGKVAGLFFTEGKLAADSDDSEPRTAGESVTFSADPRYPIHGRLTLPDNTEKPLPAVILIHGSGPSDKNGSIGANFVFADIAEGLSAHGIAVLCYDKRTFTYGAEIVADGNYAKFTIAEETTDDAAAAVRFLRADSRIDENRIYLLGHSMGGGLLSYIGQSEPVAGYIIMAGTTRSLWELSEEQNLALVEEMDEAAADAARELVRAEAEKARRLSEMTEDEALRTTIFGMPGYYLKSFEGIDAAALHLSDKKPVLILAGGRDKQVPPEDMERWRARLSGHPAAEFKMYPRLNHIFGEYTGEDVPLSQLIETEYRVRTPVPEEVIGDIARHITRG